jgi:hypothetical protein
MNPSSVLFISVSHPIPSVILTWTIHLFVDKIRLIQDMIFIFSYGQSERTQNEKRKSTLILERNSNPLRFKLKSSW